MPAASSPRSPPRFCCRNRRRERSPRSVAREMALLWRERGTRLFVFQDDDFLGDGRAANLERLASLETAFADEGLPPVALAIKARPDSIDADVVAGLRRLGLAQVFLGVETASARGLNALARAVTPDKVRRALETLHAADIFVASNLMLWHPDGTFDDLHENLDLLASFPDQLFNLGRTEPYEGAPLTARLAREGRLRGDWRNRDYRVEDPDARLALELFAATLAARCRSDGSIPLAQRAGTAAAAASRLLDPSQVAPLARRTRAAVGRLAASNRGILATIVELAASGRTARADAVGRLRSELAVADATLSSELRGLLVRLEALVVSNGRRAVRRSPWRSPARLAAVAAAGALACSQPQAPVSRPGEPEAGTSRPDVSGPEVETLAGLDVELNTDQRFIPGGPCSPPTFLPSAVAATIAADPAAGRIEAIDVRGGALERALVAPDGSRAVASLVAGTETGEGELLVQIRRTDGTAAVLARTFFWAGGYAFATDDERQQFLNPPPPPYHGFMGCDPPGPMPVMPFTPTEFFAEDGRVSFAMRYGRPVGWAFDLGFAAGVAGNEGATVEPLPAICEFGRLDVGVPVERESMPPGWFACAFSPYNAEGVTYLREGSFACTVSFRLRSGDGDEETVSGNLPVHVAPDGTVTLGDLPPDALPTD
ncbi:MAG: radical SAM protein [Deltaproteobacteria bacterium]|nr:radical SAM protein [Deltaproteobacteria bacterium]